jgi:N6-adenosine-specific RNA methylase IME4
LQLAYPGTCGGGLFLLLWATNPMLKSALALIEAWGFTYKTVAFTWTKLNSKVISPPYSSEDFFMGTGYWTRANPEQCLLATIGKPRRLSKAVRQLIISPRREHSRKPDEAYGRIEDLASGPYLELFARRSRLVGRHEATRSVCLMRSQYQLAIVGWVPLGAE